MKKWSQENNDILLNKHQNGEDVKSIVRHLLVALRTRCSVPMVIVDDEKCD
jgi:hypothetical protein